MHLVLGLGESVATLAFLLPLPAQAHTEAPGDCSTIGKLTGKLSRLSYQHCSKHNSLIFERESQGLEIRVCLQDQLFVLFRHVTYLCFVVLRRILRICSDIVEQLRHAGMRSGSSQLQTLQASSVDLNTEFSIFVTHGQSKSNTLQSNKCFESITEESNALPLLQKVWTSKINDLQ